MQKPMYTSSIVQVRANETIPATLLGKLLQENQTCFGMVIREPNNMFVEKFPKLKGVEDNKTFLNKIEENTKKYPRMLCFHSYPEEFDEDEVMPWTVLKDSKGNPLLTIAIEGDLPNYVNDEFCEPFNLLNDWLGPKIEAMYTMLGNNPAKLFEYLRTAQFQSDVKNVIGHRAVLAFMPVSGDPFVIEHNEIGVIGTWGSASNAYGYTESAIEAATPAAAEAPAAPAVRKSRYADDSPAPAAPKPTSDPPRADPAPAKSPEEKVAASLQPELVEWTPPKGLQGKPLKAAYRAVNGGDLPTKNAQGAPCSWHERPTIMIKVVQKAAVVEHKADTAVKDMKAAAPQPTTKILTVPVLSGKEQGAAVDFIKKYLGDGSAVIEDPIKAQEQEQKLAKFSELVLKTGNLDELERWTNEFLFAFCEKHWQVTAHAIRELIGDRRRLKESVAAGGKTLGELAGTKTSASAPAAPAASSATTAQPGPRKSKYA